LQAHKRLIFNATYKHLLHLHTWDSYRETIYLNRTRTTHRTREKWWEVQEGEEQKEEVQEGEEEGWVPSPSQDDTQQQLLGLELGLQQWFLAPAVCRSIAEELPLHCKNLPFLAAPLQDKFYLLRNICRWAPKGDFFFAASDFEKQAPPCKNCGEFKKVAGGRNKRKIKPKTRVRYKLLKIWQVPGVIEMAY
jgi:hypothetical protein